MRALIMFAGLPEPEVNADIYEGGEFVGCGDLVLRKWRLVVEYEGRQHALSTRQFATDITRYGRFRRLDWSYLQVTAHLAARPRSLIFRVHDELVRRGYDGPAPSFGARWQSLFAPAAHPRRFPRAVRQQPHSA